MAALQPWTTTDALEVDVLGVGLGNSVAAQTTATLAIPDPSNVVKVFAQVITKAGESGEGPYVDPTEVTIEGFDASDTLIASKSMTAVDDDDKVEVVAIESQDGLSGTVGLSHEAEIAGPVASVRVTLSDGTVATFPRSPRALIVSVFRDVGDGTASAGSLPNVYLFGNDGYPAAQRTVALPVGFAGGDVTLTFAISDLEMVSRSSGYTSNDPRIVLYEASAGGVTSGGSVDVPNMGADLAIVELVLHDVPAGTTEVAAGLTSPARQGSQPVWGDSVYWNAVNVTVGSTPPVVPPTEEPGTEGCTPGYWRQEHHFDSWSGYTPDQLFSDVFGEVITVRTGGNTTKDDPTLLEAVWANGGGVNALARHATAALLNTASAGVDYPYTTQQVIDLVHAAVASGDYEGAKNTLAAANELGCGLN